MSTRWQLPPQLDDIRPPYAWQFEQLRRHILDYLVEQGFAYVHPPIVEHLETLSAAPSALPPCLIHDSSTDTLAIRTDITAQITRMDASLRNDGIMRYCYAGEVLTPPTTMLQSPRNPYKCGAELFGDENLQADIDVVRHVLNIALQCQAHALTLNISDARILKALFAQNPDLLPIYQQHDRSRLQATQTSSLHGAMDWSGNYLDAFAQDMDACGLDISDAQHAGAIIAKEFTNITLHYDFTNIDGLNAYTGINWQLYSNQCLIARGGRYDGIGEAFGHARAAVGFSVDMHSLLSVQNNTNDT